MKSLGYYAMSKKTKTLYQFEWSEDNKLFVFILEEKQEVNPDDFEILEIGCFTDKQ